VAYNNALEKLVAEENEERSKLPRYKGLERYELIEKMGDGAFSIVYKAKDLQTNEYVAIKVIHKQDLNTSQVSLLIGKQKE
jgi:serine/threonine-protein kinase RCK2